MRGENENGRRRRSIRTAIDPETNPVFRKVPSQTARRNPWPDAVGRTSQPAPEVWPLIRVLSTAGR
jgi:hypothetical protein